MREFISEVTFIDIRDAVLILFVGWVFVVHVAIPVTEGIESWQNRHETFQELVADGHVVPVEHRSECTDGVTVEGTEPGTLVCVDANALVEYTTR